MKQSLIYAGRLERLFAYLIDTLILIVPGMLLAALFKGHGVVTLAAFLVSLSYYTYFVASRWQATPGKRLMNIYIIRSDNQMLSPRDALERFLAFFLPSLPIYTSFIPDNVTPIIVFWLSMFWFSPILYTAERIGVHDRLCNTRVLVGRVGT